LCPFCPPPGRPDGSRRLTGFFLSPHRSTAVSNSSNCPDPAAGEAPHSQPATLPTLAEATQSGPRLPTEESFLKQNHDFLAKAPHSSPKNKNHPACDKSDSPNWAVTIEIIGARIGRFRRIGYFQWLDPHFVSRDSQAPAPMKSPNPPCRQVLKNSSRRQSAGQENVGSCPRPSIRRLRRRREAPKRSIEPNLV
jgi:hypothetical protein